MALVLSRLNMSQKNGLDWIGSLPLAYTPAEFLADVATETDLEATNGHHEDDSMNSINEYGERRHVHDDTDKELHATEATTHAAMHNHTFLVRNDEELQQANI